MFRLSLVLPLVFAGLCCLFTPTTKAQAQDGQRWRQLESQHHVRVSGPHEFTPWFEYDWDSDEEEPSVGGTRFLMTKKDVFKKSAKKTKKENKPKPKPKKKGEKKKAAKKETKGSKSTEGKGEDEDEDEDEDQPVTLLPSKRFYSSPYDARLFSFSLDDYNVTFLGPFGKNIDIPLQLQISSSNGTLTTFTMNEFGNVTKMQVVDENDEIVEFEFDYQETELGLKLNMPEFGYSAAFNFPPFEYNTTEFPVVGDPFSSNSAARLLQGSAVDKEGQRYLQDGVTFAEVWIFLVECLRNIDPTELRVSARSEGNSQSIPITPERQSEGFYKAKFAVTDTGIADDVVGYACTGISLTGSYACPFILALGPGSPYLCALAAGALTSTGAGAVVAAPAFSACLAGFAGGSAVCAVYEIAGGGAPPGAPNLIDVGCEATSDLAGFVEDLFFPETVTITAEARLPTSGDFVSGATTFQPEVDGTVGDPIGLEGPGIPEVTSFVAIPSNPVESQSYTAFAFIICARPETTASITVQGTDGYAASITCLGPALQTDKGCSIVVPGAESGVVDTLTVRVNDPTTGERIQVIGLFFR